MLSKLIKCVAISLNYTSWCGFKIFIRIVVVSQPNGIGVCAHVKNGEYIFSDDRIKYNFNINLEATIVKTTSNWIAHWYTVSEELVYMSISISEHLYSDYIEMLCVELRREMTIDEKIYMCLLKLSDRCAWSTRCSLCRMGQIYTRRSKKRMRSKSIAKKHKTWRLMILL